MGADWDAVLPGPFTVAQARAAGITGDMLRSRRVRAIGPGVYVAAGTPDTARLRLAAVSLLTPPDAAFSHDTAVQLLGLPTRWVRQAVALPTPVHVSVPSTSVRPRIRGVRGHEVEWLPGDVGVLDGLRVTSIPRTWCDLAAEGWPRNDLVAYADAVLRRFPDRGLAALSRRVQAWDGRRGVRRLRQALELTRPRVDSPPESLLRLVIRDAGLPEPEVNVPVFDEDAMFVHTPDLTWRRYRYAADYDGAHHFERDSDDDVLAGRRENRRRRHDVSRQQGLIDLGWGFTVVTAYDLYLDRDRLLARFRRALRERGADC